MRHVQQDRNQIQQIQVAYVHYLIGRPMVQQLVRQMVLLAVLNAHTGQKEILLIQMAQVAQVV